MLINLYREKECLWNYKSSLYKRTDLKNKVWFSMSQELNKEEAEIKKKVKNLRSVYVAENKKLKASHRSGASSEEVYESHLFYFNDFSFLDSVIFLRKTHNNFSLDDTLERADEAVEAVEVMDATGSLEVFAYSPSPNITVPTGSGSVRRSSARRPTSSSTRSSRYEDAIAGCYSPKTRFSACTCINVREFREQCVQSAGATKYDRGS